MPKHVYNNVIGERVFDGGVVIEDVTTVTPPSLSHPTTSIQKVTGLYADLNIPDDNRFEAMELSIAHNNGLNCRKLTEPGIHNLEFRIARQRFDTINAQNELESVKVMATAAHVSTDKGTFELGNPYGSTEKYAVLHYREEIDGVEVVNVSALTGGHVNGVSISDKVEALLA